MCYYDFMIKEYLFTRINMPHHMVGSTPREGVFQIDNMIHPHELEEQLLKYAKRYKLDIENLRVIIGGLKSDAGNVRKRIDHFTVSEHIASRDIICGIRDEDCCLSDSYVYNNGEIIVVTLNSGNESYMLYVNPRECNASEFLAKTNSLACLSGSWLLNKDLLQGLYRRSQNIGLVIKTSADINELNRYKVLQTI